MKTSLDKFFNPKSVAVVGASTTPGKLGYVAVENLIRLGYPGKIFPVNPKANEIQGLKAYPNVKDIPEPVDVGLVLVPAEAVVGVVKDLAEKGVKHTVIIAGGFSEVDEKGAKMQQEIVEIGRKYGMRIIGPNTTGIVSIPGRFSTTFFKVDYNPGSAAYIAQTGNFASITFRWIVTRENFGISRIIGLGNKCDVDDADALEYLESDPHTKVIAMYIEGLKDGRRFVEVAKRVSKKKPILALKSGRTPAGSKAAMSHTASLAADDAILDAALKQAGVIRVNNYMDLVNYTKAFVFQQPPKGNKVGVITPSGGLGVISADACQLLGLDLANLSEKTLERFRKASPPFIRVGNPYDIWPSVTYIGVDEAYKVGIEALFEDENVDAIIAGFQFTEGFELKDHRFISEASRKHPDKPIIAYASSDWVLVEKMRAILEKENIPVYYSPEEAAQALAVMYRYSKIRGEAD
ncbi:CoA-binding protein [Candidatus Bathyarchaeota archaeon]|nr:CoA-binding protein [Candidatus Bathyarchaeota archaeon]MBS7629851.1 CoA-binding protein [Candidatus Bathyarchaeota archaeon]